MRFTQTVANISLVIRIIYMNFSQKYRNNKFALLFYSSTPKIINDIVFSVYGIIKYFEYLKIKSKYLPELKINEFKTREDIQEIQENKLKKIIKHAYDNTEYYKKVIDDCNLNPYDFSFKDLKKLPILTKDILQANNKKLTASNHKIYNSVQQSSGGTTGTTINFLMDKENYMYKEAEVMLYWERFGYFVGKSKAVMFRANILFSTDGKVPNKPWRRDYGRKLLYISSYYASNNYYKKYYLKLKKWKPDFMHVLPSAGFLFATYLNEKNLKLKFKKIFSASEMLYPSHKEAMEKAFNCEVVDHYGHSEPGIYSAGECVNKNLHICDTNTIVEQDNDGSIIETSLNNFSTPFIRYKVGDKIESISSGNCNCGIRSSYISKVIGRDSEILFSGDGRKISSIGFDQIFRHNNIKIGQIIQEVKGELTLNVVTSFNFDLKNEESVLKELTSRVGQATIINFNKVKHIKNAKSGKYRLIVSKINDKKNE